MLLLDSKNGLSSKLAKVNLELKLALKSSSISIIKKSEKGLVHFRFSPNSISKKKCCYYYKIRTTTTIF